MRNDVTIIQQILRGAQNWDDNLDAVIPSLCEACLLN